MFDKCAVIITQCFGASAKDIKYSLSWWGISKIRIFTGALMGEIVWDKLSKKNAVKNCREKYLNFLTDFQK